MPDAPWLAWALQGALYLAIVVTGVLVHRRETARGVDRPVRPPGPGPVARRALRLLYRLRRRRPLLPPAGEVAGPRVQVALLQGGRIVVDGRTVPLVRRRGRAHLMLIALRRGRYVHVEDLAAAVRDRGPGRRRATVETIDRVVALTESVAQDAALPVQRRGDSWMLPDTPGLLDLDDLDVLLRRGLDDLGDGRLARAAATLGTVVRLVPRTPLRHLDGADVDRARVALLGRRHDAERARAQAEHRLAERTRVAQVARAAVDTDPHDETAWEAYALALHRAGRTPDALAALATARERLARDLGARPGPRLRLLRSRIEADDPTLLTEGPVTP